MYALEGIKVLDMAQHTAGPTTSMYLGDQGAEVVKVEPRVSGDHSRTANTTKFLGLNGLGFMTMSRNKKSMTLDITKPEGREVLQDLLKWADVLVHNFRPRAAKRYGLDYRTASDLNPGLIYATVSAFGNEGPYAEQGGYDRIIQGLAGVMFRRMPDGTPITAGIYAADGALPMMMAFGIMLALRVRDRTGRGQKVDGSLLHTYLALQAAAVATADDDPTPRAPDDGRNAYGIYRCGDGAFINIAPNNDKQLFSLLTAMGLDEVAKDPRAHDPTQRMEFRSAVLNPVVEERFKAKSREDWLRILQAADVPCGPILDRHQVVDEPQVVANRMMVAVDHPSAGRTRILNTPIKLSETPGDIRTPAPELGQHTDEVLRCLGYPPDRIAVLRAADAI